MAFFKFRKGGGDTVSAAASPAESVEVLRKRARQRLIGAAVLVLAGVIGFPLVFDSQPRPIAVDIPIDIPDRAAKPAKPASGGASALAAAPAAASGGEAVVARPDALAVASGPAPVFQPAAVAAAAAPAVAPAPAAPASAKSAPEAARPASAAKAPAETAKSAPAPASASRAASAPAKPASKAAVADADRARALLDGQSAPAAAANGRFVVQVGAFAEPAKAQAARSKLEKAGLKTYTHVADTKEGKRTRVRVGPFDSRAEADKAAAKVKGLGLTAAVLTL